MCGHGRTSAYCCTSSLLPASVVALQVCYIVLISIDICIDFYRLISILKCSNVLCMV